MLLARGAEPDAQDKYGHSPLHRAASKGYDKVIEMMMQVINSFSASATCPKLAFSALELKI